jgi:hypothetical protein
MFPLRIAKAVAVYLGRTNGFVPLAPDQYCAAGTPAEFAA